nr:hypothetical protein [Tanacetum cinerariifolium]
GNPVDGHYCQGCALLRKNFKEDLFTYCIENGIFQDSSEPSNDNTNVVNALSDPFVVNQHLVTPSLSIEEPDNSLSMRDEHLDTISAIESDEFIKSSVENLVLIPNQFEDFFDSNNESTSTDDDSFSIHNIEYVVASPPDSELVSSEVMEIVILEVGGIDDDILLTIKDDILREKLLNSDFYEFADELTYIISPPEYDCFCFKNEPNSGDFTMDVV